MNTSYEGISAGLFKRSNTEIEFKNGKNSMAIIYVPTENLIRTYNLRLELDKEDRWKNEIKKYPEIVSKFPELLV